MKLALAVCALLACGTVQAELDRAAFIALSSKVLKIEATRQQGGYALGSGVLVAPQRLLTNCHVTRDARDIHAYQFGVRLRVAAQTSDVPRDLCLLTVPGLAGEAVAHGASGALRAGQAVAALGYTGGLGLQNSAGEVVALHPYDGAQVIQSSNWFTSGASGGGLFDDDSRLVGIMTFRLRGGTAHYYSVPVEWAADLLARDGNAARAVAPLPPAEQAFWQRPHQLQPPFLHAAPASAHAPR